MKKTITILTLLGSWAFTEASAMTQDEMEKAVAGIVEVEEAQKGYVVSCRCRIRNCTCLE